jgi:hypothetical protein
MADEISYHEVVAFLTKIEPDYARNYSFKIYVRDRAAMRGKGRVVAAVRDRWPSLTAQEASAFVQLFLAA